MKKNTITESSIKELVDTFYLKVRSDKNLGPVFNNAIGTSDHEWQQHLQIMYDFWSSVMLGSNRYNGNPHQTHRLLPKFDVQLFDQWLKLFHQTANDIHSENIYQEYKLKSSRIAQSLKLSVQGSI